MKHVICALIILLPTTIFSQLNKGQWLIGGNGMFSYSKSKYTAVSSWQLTPGAGYFLIDKLAAGLRGTFTSDKYSFETEQYRFSTITLSPFARYYFLPAEQKVNLFADASFGYSWGNSKHFDPENHWNYQYYNVTFMAGPAIFLNKHTALEFTVGYNFASRGPADTTATSKIQVGIGLQIHLGK